MKTAYFTFGQNHVHNLFGIMFDKDCVVQITSPDPRTNMFDLFGTKWSMQYEQKPDLAYFPRGIVEHFTFPA